MLPVKTKRQEVSAAEASAAVEWLWVGFMEYVADRSRERCACGCSFDHSLHLYGPEHDDELVAEHLDMTTLDPYPVTRLENLWRHYMRWGHDGRNPLGGRAVALPTWLDRR